MAEQNRGGLSRGLAAARTVAEWFGISQQDAPDLLVPKKGAALLLAQQSSWAAARCTEASYRQVLAGALLLMKFLTHLDQIGVVQSRTYVSEIANQLGLKLRKDQKIESVLVRAVLDYEIAQRPKNAQYINRDWLAVRYLSTNRIKWGDVEELGSRKGEGVREWAERQRKVERALARRGIPQTGPQALGKLKPTLGPP